MAREPTESTAATFKFEVPLTRNFAAMMESVAVSVDVLTLPLFVMEFDVTVFKVLVPLTRNARVEIESELSVVIFAVVARSLLLKIESLAVNVPVLMSPLLLIVVDVTPCSVDAPGTFSLLILAESVA